MCITEIYEQNIQYLSSLEGASRVTAHVDNVTEQFRKIEGVKCVMGVGYPYYFSDETGIQIDPAIIQEYRNYNTARLRMMQDALGDKEWNCPSCPALSNSRECCNGGKVTVYEVMRSSCDADMFVIIDDSSGELFQKSFSELRELILQNPKLRTWDQDLSKGIVDYINGKALFTDIHVIRTSQLSQALDQLATFINRAINFDPETHDIQQLAPIIQTRINDIAWRGCNNWDYSHALPLVWDLLISGRSIFQELSDDLISKINKIGCILGNDREKCRKVLQTATRIFKPGNKEERFVFEEDQKVMEAMISSLLSAFPVQEI